MPPPPKQNTEEYGWTAAPRNRSDLPSASSLSSASTASAADNTLDFENDWPDTELVRKAKEYVQGELGEEVLNHSLRVYYYGYTILRNHLPSWLSPSSSSPSTTSAPPKSNPFLETWALTCLFHDLATTPNHRSSTHLSFEFQGGFLALRKLLECGAPPAQAESVCEAIIRHQDPGDSGAISRMGMLVQVATEFDNMGWQAHLVDESVIRQAVRRFPRLEWSSCFAATIRAEIEAKPWCHSTAIPGFAEAIEGNEVMRPFE